MAKLQISIRVSNAGKELLDTLQERLGVTQASVFELALRELAKREGIPVPDASRRERTNAAEKSSQPA